MDEQRAIAAVLRHLRGSDHDYPTDDLTAAAFDGGWCVYAPVMLADRTSLTTRSVFLVDGNGHVREVTSDAPVEEATLWFEESCLWFSATAGGDLNSGLPSHPDLGGSSRPRLPADYDQPALDVLAKALAHERDFGGWLSDRLRELAHLLGGGSRLVAKRPNTWAASHVTELVEPYDGAPREIWRTWPPIDPATLPEVDTTGWVLTPFAAMAQFLEELEATGGDADEASERIGERAERTPRWLACGVAHLEPQLVALRRTPWFDNWSEELRRIATEDGDDEFARMLTTGSAIADADVQALLRIAVAAQLNDQDVIEADVATTAAYRRVLDRMGLPFDNYAFEAMYE